MEPISSMIQRVLLLLTVILGTAAAAQTSPKPAPSAATATAAKPSTNAAKPALPAPSVLKLPEKIPAVHGMVKTAFSLRYEDIKIGTGADAEPGKLYKVKYTGYRWADGVVFDSTDMHRRPVLDKDGKPVNGPDGKPQLGDPEPMQFPQGMGRLIPGFDQGFAGMKIGGKRRIFIPWQLAYGTREIPERGPDHPGIPAKSDLIFDVELVDVSDLPVRNAMQPGPPRPGAIGAPPVPGAALKPGVTPAAPPAGGAPPATSEPAPQANTPPPSGTPPAQSNPPQPH